MNLKLKKLFKSQFLKKNGAFRDLPSIQGLEISSLSAGLYKKRTEEIFHFFILKMVLIMQEYSQSRRLALSASNGIKYQKQQKLKHY